MAAYGFVSGLPLPLSGFTFRLWLSDSGTALSVVGLTAWIGLAYSLKFLWAPLLDQPPPLAALRRLGRRRGWLLLVQPLLGLAAVLLALSNPAAAPVAAFAAAACVAVLSATQDIAVDAWRIEIFPQRRQGVALAVYVWGYRVAMLVSTTGVIAAAAYVGWHQALLGVAVLIAAGSGVTLAAAREDGPAAIPPRGLRHAVIDPVRSFLARPSSLAGAGLRGAVQARRGDGRDHDRAVLPASDVRQGGHRRRPGRSRSAGRWRASPWAAGWWRASELAGRCC